jgi:hypothetical protein
MSIAGKKAADFLSATKALSPVKPNGVWLCGEAERAERGLALGFGVEPTWFSRSWSLVGSMIRRTRNQVVHREVGTSNGCDQRPVLRILIL